MESVWAYIAEDSEPHFPAGAVERGTEYFHQGRVAIRKIDAQRTIAVVRGTRAYDVLIRRDTETGRIESSCTCPAAARGPCKHIFATLLEVEDQARAFSDAGRRPMGAAPTPPPVTLPPDRPAWQYQIARLGQPHARDPWAHVAGANAQPVVVLCARASASAGVPVIRIMTRSWQRNGAWSAPTNLPPYGGLPRMDTDGIELVALATGLETDGAGRLRAVDEPWVRLDQRKLPGSGARARLIAVARRRALHLGETSGKPQSEPLEFDEDGPFAFRLSVEGDTATGVTLAGSFRRDGQRIPLEEPRLLFDCGLMVHGNTLVDVDFGGAWDWALRLRTTGPVDVPPEGYGALMERLLQHGAPLPLEGAIARVESHEESVPVRAALHLTFTPPPDPRYGSIAVSDFVPVQGIVDFRYGDAVIEAESPSRHCIDPTTGALVRRDFEAESALLARLLELGATPGSTNETHTANLPRRHALRIATELQREGWKIATDGQAWRDADDFSLRVSSGIDWFDLEGGLRFGDEVVGIPALLRAIGKGEGAVQLKDGSRGMLDDNLAARLRLFTGLSQVKGDGLRFAKNQGWILDALLREQDGDYAADSEFKKLRENARRFEGIKPRNASSQFQGELRPYQRDALGWFRYLQTMGLGGCLADDMGLGKTVMVLAHLLHYRREHKKADRRPALVVAPKSLVWNWIEEAHRFAPALSVLDYSGPAAQRNPDLIAGHDLVVTTYGVLRRDAAKLRELPLSHAILDEAQAIKNPGSQAWKAARLLSADHRLALTGTPVENHLGDLWAIMDFLNPGMLGPRATHGEWAKADADGTERRDRVARLVRPLLLRRTKEQVLKDLPERQETLLHCEMGPKQKRCYNELRDHYRAILLNRIDTDGLANSKMHVLEALLRLRQAACHPGLLDGERKEQPSAKFDALLPRLQEVHESGRKALVFSQFTSLLAILRAQLDAEGIRYAYLDGQTRGRKRIVEEFQGNAELPLFLISLKAGGVGLNLTAADHVFLLDPWWNPAVERQAVDRAHRIGQDKVVNVYRLVAADTVEERILELQERKRELAEAIVGSGSGLLRHLTRDDLAALLGEKG